jgi:hypothetical protein
MPAFEIKEFFVCQQHSVRLLEKYARKLSNEIFFFKTTAYRILWHLLQAAESLVMGMLQCCLETADDVKATMK